jgi:FkbM family methyltransferase
MSSSLRIKIKGVFDDLVYSYPGLNKILRNINKLLSDVTGFRLRPYGTLSIRFNSGVKFKMETNETSTVTKKLFWQGADNYEYTRVFEKLIANATVFFDVGSSIGYYSLLSAKVNPSIKVVAFEPATGPYFYLSRNIGINSLGNQIIASRIALSDEQGEVEFNEFQNSPHSRAKYNLGGAGSLKINFDSQQRHTAKVKVTTSTMDNFCSVNNIPYPDVIKLDTEGTEDMVLKGAGQVLANEPIIICETLFNIIEHKLEAIMKPLGYGFYNFQNNKLIKVDSIVRASDNGVRDCFFIPPSKYSWVKEFVTSAH